MYIIDFLPTDWDFFTGVKFFMSQFSIFPLLILDFYAKDFEFPIFFQTSFFMRFLFYSRLLILLHFFLTSLFMIFIEEGFVNVCYFSFHLYIQVLVAKFLQFIWNYFSFISKIRLLLWCYYWISVINGREN